jgi:hypothetical protein
MSKFNLISRTYRITRENDKTVKKLSALFSNQAKRKVSEAEVLRVAIDALKDAHLPKK